MDDSAPEDERLDPFENPYHPFDEPRTYRAFETGWCARKAGSPRTANPYPFSLPRQALAWLDGWTSADSGDEWVRADTPSSTRDSEGRPTIRSVRTAQSGRARMSVVHD